jgi:quercetin dioxygenase-like cupin family protein
MRTLLPLVAAAVGLAGCAARQPRIVVPPLDGGLDAFVAAHPLAPEQNIRADEVARTAGATYHVVQVRAGEVPHRHLAHDMTVLVLEGSGTLMLDDVRVPMRAGDVAVVARGRPHWFTNGEHSPAVALVAFTPPLDAPDAAPVADVDSGADGR